MIEKMKKLKALATPLIAFFAGNACTCCAYALLSSILAIRVGKSGVSTSLAGLVLSCYYAGFMLSSLRAHVVINKVGHIRAFTAFISVFSSLTLLHFFSDNLYFWGVLRFLEGACIGAAAMCLESWLNSRASNRHRGIVMSMYMITSYLGASTGQLLLNIPDPNGAVIYIVISVLFSIAIIPISLTALPTPDITVHKSISLKTLYKKTPVGVMGCLVSGVLVGCFYTLGAVYASKIGLNIQQTSLFMFFGIIGGFIVQMPVGRLSDSMDRRIILLVCCSILVVFMPVMVFMLDKGTPLLAFATMIWGACVMLLYPISVSHVNDLVSEEERTTTSGKMVLLQGFGLVGGPVIVSALMQLFGAHAYLIFFSLASLAFVVFTKKHMKIKPDINYVSNTPTEPISVSATLVLNNSDDADRSTKKL